MSQMPDKIWLHKDTKYNTGDIVCGYQYEFAEGIEDEGGIKNFVEYVPKDTFIEKACEWIKEHKEKEIVKTKEEILSTFNTPEGAYWAYREGMKEGFADMQNALRNQAAIAAMQGTITILSSSDRYVFRDIVIKGYSGKIRTYSKEIAEFAVKCADELIEELKKQK